MTVAKFITNRQEHFDFMNKFGEENLTTLTFRLTIRNDRIHANNIMELLADLKNLRVRAEDMLKLFTYKILYILFLGN